MCRCFLPNLYQTIAVHSSPFQFLFINMYTCLYVNERKKKKKNGNLWLYPYLLYCNPSTVLRLPTQTATWHVLSILSWNKGKMLKFRRTRKWVFYSVFLFCSIWATPTGELKKGNSIRELILAIRSFYSQYIAKVSNIGSTQVLGVGCSLHNSHVGHQDFFFFFKLF